MDRTAARLLLNEEGRLRLRGPAYAACPRDETDAGHRYSVGLRDIDGKTHIALVIDYNGMAKDMGVDCEVETVTHLIPADFEGVVLEIV